MQNTTITYEKYYLKYEQNTTLACIYLAAWKHKIEKP